MGDPRARRWNSDARGSGRRVCTVAILPGCSPLESYKTIAGTTAFIVCGALGAAEELRVALFGGTPLVTRGAVDIFRHDWSLDSSGAQRDLGYAITPLEDGVRRTLAALGHAV